MSENKAYICKTYSSEDLYLRYAKGPSIENGREFHTYNEILFIPEINGKLITENGDFKICDGSLIVIPKEAFHHLEITCPDRYTRFCFNFENIRGLDEAIEACTQKICVIEKPGEKITALFNSMLSIFDESEADKGILIHAVFSEILIYLKKELKYGTVTKSRDENSVIYKALKYINKNYCNNISISDISESLNISPSSLSHIFKKSLNISVYKYITDKRMVLAKKLLNSGTPPTAVCDKCGYTDYTVFYRIYKKHYGISPKKTGKSNIEQELNGN